ncbi:MAG: hypothetical protein AAF740_10975, partial [Bacteroidota bacterium]
LRQISSSIERIAAPTSKKWEQATLVMKKALPFKEIAKSQGNKRLTFSELYPCIQDIENENYSLQDLLNAAK